MKKQMHILCGIFAICILFNMVFVMAKGVGIPGEGNPYTGEPNEDPEPKQMGKDYPGHPNDGWKFQEPRREPNEPIPEPNKPEPQGPKEPNKP